MAKKPFQRRDHFYRKAKKEGYPARSAYKIMELDRHFGIFKPGNTIVDLGAAPGGWFQVGQERLGGNGLLVGVDILPLSLALAKGCHFLKGDFTKQDTQAWIRSKVKSGADWVISDMAPNTSGVKFKDQFASFELCRQALVFAIGILKPGGGFLCKLFPGEEQEAFRKEMKLWFSKIKTVIPQATRSSSREVYVVGTGFKVRPEEAAP